MASLKEKLTKKNTFDSDMNLIGFSNGVYDFKKREFRKTRSSDMIRMSCGYDYCYKYENREELIELLSSIFPNKKEEDVEYFLVC